MGRWLVSFLALVMVSTQARPLRVDVPSWLHCQAESTRDCTAANGRADALKLAASRRYVFFVAGGPAWPQEPITITVAELNTAGIGAWFTGDFIEETRSAYIDAFNDAMENAFTARRGTRALQDVRARIDIRIKAAETRRTDHRP